MRIFFAVCFQRWIESYWGNIGPEKSYTVYQDIPYAHNGHEKQRLDVYRPKVISPGNPFPVLVFVHGGGWHRGDRRELFGMYSNLGDAMARRGICTVVPSYRLSPMHERMPLFYARLRAFIVFVLSMLLMILLVILGFVQSFLVMLAIPCLTTAVVFMVSWYTLTMSLPRKEDIESLRHPMHAKDIALAFKWTIENIKDPSFFGDPTNVFLGGHSAGGHLSALIASDPSYLTEHGIDVSCIRGVITVSGPFSCESLSKTPFTRMKYLEGPFGSNPDKWKYAFPLLHIGPHCPPFLLLNAAEDGGLEHHSWDLIRLLSKHNVPNNWFVVPNTNHISIVVLINSEYDEVTSRCVDFIRKTLR